MSQIDLTLENLHPNDVVPSLAEHEGHKAVRLVLTPDAETPDNPTFARINNLEFHNGVIEIEVAGRPLPDAIPEARGFMAWLFASPMTFLPSSACIYVQPMAVLSTNSAVTAPPNIFLIPIGNSIVYAQRCQGITRLMSIL